ncbi:hypothetical protein KKE03_04760 [Patescibacteria group bacterium]|nr:hypothetical protein [Patescibacteria group bacterium]
MSTIEKYLSQKELVQNVLTVEELKDKAGSGKTLNMMMGQTFDEGQPVDMMKYALFMMNLTDILRQDGVQVTARWLIADHFITDINQELEAVKAIDQVDRRVSYLERINRAYGGDIGIVFSSQLSQQDEYSENLEILLKEADRNAKFREKSLKAVPEDRRNNPNALRYPFEELATIQSMDTDIKVGPPYEIHYDEPARDIAPLVGFNRYVAIHLTRGFPFGSPTISSDVREEIEAFGVLPYKKDSKGLGNYRIDPTIDGIERIQRLVSATIDTRTIIDLLVITEQARQRLEGQVDPSGVEKILEKTYNSAIERQSFKALQELALESYVRYIHEPLRAK